MDGDLRAQLVRAVGEVDAPPSNRFEARRRARGAMEAAEALLRSEGYYQPVLQDVVEGEEAPVAIVDITPGRRFVLGETQVLWTAPPPDAATETAVMGRLGLVAGDPGRAADVISAEGRLVAGLARRGYADAAAEPRRVLVDHATFTVQPSYRIASGPLVRLDGVRLETRGTTNPNWVAGLAPWSEGDVYDPEDVAELERRLLETGVYDGVGVALAPTDQTRADGHRPIIVTLTDRPRRILEAGATFSTAEGSGVDAIWTWHNWLGRADTLVWQARAADIDSRLGVNLGLPHWRRPGQTLRLSAAVLNENTDAYRRTAAALAADLQRRIGKTSWISYGIGLDAGRYDENRFDPVTQLPISFSRDLVILTGRGSAYLDRSNDPLDPTTGWRLSVSARPTAVAGEDTVLFLRTEAQTTAYLPLQDGARTVLAGRLRIGSIFGGEELTVPSDRLFYSGGGGSVRGYQYQGVGPRLPDNTPRGGLSLFETSVEVRRDVGRNFQAVAFVDAGAIGFQETPNFNNLRYGAGVGVRYKLPFGPIRADIAFPIERREGDADFQIYVSIGQAF
ncbi:MAG: autotransporter assembly complex family protein [Brevundimonas sp.]|nr:autotransporter assembly complex family protein [Brevundimonas sp.]MDO9588982.1 autotransporter assembly complex family protein [Brevundimonas sp.]MDP3657289.1 autotransporter assembly complex family protein [Brevundimonas sp.]MDZ4060594.1 autotransporter assembly complex family protein [Brevundimonas sp.]